MFPVFTISFHHSKEVFVCCLIVSLRCVFWVGLSIRGGGSDSPRPASQRAAALVLTAAMLTTLTAPAFAKTWDIEKGDITVKAGEAEGPNKVKQGDSDFVKDEGDTIITGKSDKNTVTIDTSEGNVDVTFDDLKIDASSRVNPSATTLNDTSYAAVNVTGKGDTNIELDGDNELKSGRYRAGLEHNQTADSEGNVTSGKLTIQDDKDNAGSLTATGGESAAGIGGGNANAGQVTITGGNITATGGYGSAGIGGGYGQGSPNPNAGDGDVTISGGTIKAAGGTFGAGIGGGYYGNGTVTITGDAVIENASNESGSGAGIGGGIFGLGNVTIEGNTKVNATGGAGGAAIGGGAGAENSSDNKGNQITIKSNENGSPTVKAFGGGTDEEEEIVIGGAGIGAGCESDADADITLEGKVTITATAGKDNVAIGANGIEQEFTGLAEGSSITRYNSEGNNITLPTDPVPAVPSASGGGSADASVQESVFPGLVVTDKDGQRISYTSIRGNNVLSIRVGRFTASLRISLATLRQLRAEGIDTITFQTILCSTTLSVDELLAMGGEDAEAVLTHRLTASSLTVG